MGKYENECRDKCKVFFDQLTDILKEHGYKVVGSPYNKYTLQLVPEGEEGLLTYYGKPFLSFRFSNAWNWYAPIERCKDPNTVQCLNLDIPWSRRREDPEKATKPWFAWQVAIFDHDKKYHCVYGDAFDRVEKKWHFVEADPNEVANELLKKMGVTK